MIYDVIIIGAGPAGLFCGCHIHPSLNTLILEKNSKPGTKLLMSGAGQCNLTHSGSIKNFIGHYGDHGKKIRQVLYKFNNQMLQKYFEKQGLRFIEREDGKVFPATFKANDVLDILLKKCNENHVDITYNASVKKVHYDTERHQFEVLTETSIYHTKNLVVATGGASYPTTGSDGTFLKVIKDLQINIIEPKPSLVPVFIKNYKYHHLSGISFEKVEISLYRDNKKCMTYEGDLLFTHNSLSGPAILDLSRYIKREDVLVINYYNKKNKELVYHELMEVLSNKKKQMNTIIKEYFDFPKRFIDTLFEMSKIDGSKKAYQASNKEIRNILDKIMSDTLVVDHTGGFDIAMATSGGVSVDEIDFKALESKRYKGLYFIGEVIDIDGDTGGYNIQFAFSSGAFCAQHINRIVGTGLAPVRIR